MQHVACPGCGADVQFTSAASVMAVCEYCQTTVLKDAESVRDLGKMGVVLEDYSSIQIGTSGHFQGRNFNVIGRLQMRYPAGFWNEWFVMFDDGSNGWLSDASGQYTMTFQKPVPGSVRAFETLHPGQTLPLGGQFFVASDVRTATCIAGQGELPMHVGTGWTAKVADFRLQKQFLTIDYSDPIPAFYLGEAVTLSELNAQQLRDESSIADSRGNLKGHVAPLACPHCGSSIKFVPGATTALICPSCHSSIDVAGPTAEVLAAGQRVAEIPLTLKLGTTANIEGVKYTAIGALKRSSSDGSSHWTEYLLYESKKGFLWLIESSEGWQRTTVEDLWPLAEGPNTVRIDNFRFVQNDDYMARVDAAIGAFNWQVAVGDTVRVLEYRGGNQSLAAEISDTEMTFSRSRPVPLDQVRAWFGQDVHTEHVPHPSYKSTAKYFLFGLFVFDAIPLLAGGGFSVIVLLCTAAAIYLPAVLLDRMEAGSS
jgi:hypothetical protein